MKQLQRILQDIKDNDTNYDLRYKLVFRAVNLALLLGYETGVKIDPVEPDWPVVYIELPTGQVSWHIPQHPREWDGHTTKEKYSRIKEFCNA